MDWWQILLIILLFIVVGLGVGYLVGYLIVTRILKKPFILFSARQRQAVALIEKPQKSTVTPGPFTELTPTREITELQAENQAKIETQEVRKEATVVEETPKPAMPDLSVELVQERERRKAEQQTREQLKREAEEARKARINHERERRKAEQQARELAQREAEEARRAREIEEREREKAAVGEEGLKVAAPNLLAEVENNRLIANEPWTGKLIPFQTYIWNSNSAELNTLPASLREDLAQAYSDIQLANSIVWLATELGRRSPNLDENYMKLCTNIAARLETITPLLKQSVNN